MNLYKSVAISKHFDETRPSRSQMSELLQRRRLGQCPGISIQVSSRHNDRAVPAPRNGRHSFDLKITGEE